MGEVVYAPQFGGRPARPERVSTHARVLIVDRDAATLAAISQALQNEGHWTATAFDAAAAIATAERLGPFDLLIVDVDLAYGRDVEKAHNAHCGTCGSFLYSLVRDGQYIHVALGTLADEPAIRPTHHIFVGSKAPWFTITDDLPQYEGHMTR